MFKKLKRETLIFLRPKAGIGETDRFLNLGFPEFLNVAKVARTDPHAKFKEACIVVFEGT